MDPNQITQWIQVIQELLLLWDNLQQRSIAGLPVAPATAGATLLPAALQSFAVTMFPQLDPAHHLDAAVSVLSAGNTMDIQTMLNALSAGLVVDGIWGAKTTAVVKVFQGMKNLPQTGWVDNATYLALINEASRPPAERIKVQVP